MSGDNSKAKKRVREHWHRTTNDHRLITHPKRCTATAVTDRQGLSVWASKWKRLEGDLSSWEYSEE